MADIVPKLQQMVSSVKFHNDGEGCMYPDMPKGNTFVISCDCENLEELEKLLEGQDEIMILEKLTTNEKKSALEYAKIEAEHIKKRRLEDQVRLKQIKKVRRDTMIATNKLIDKVFDQFDGVAGITRLKGDYQLLKNNKVIAYMVPEDPDDETSVSSNWMGYNPRIHYVKLNKASCDTYFTEENFGRIMGEYLL
jgi:hypothetical protein